MIVCASVTLLCAQVNWIELLKKSCSSSAVGCKKCSGPGLDHGTGCSYRGRGSQPVGSGNITLAPLSIEAFHHLFIIKIILYMKSNKDEYELPLTSLYFFAKWSTL